MDYLLFYELAPDYLERRAELRNAHLMLAWQGWRVRPWTTVVGELASMPVKPDA